MLARIHGADGLQERVERRVLEQVAHRTSAQPTYNVAVAGVHRQENAPRSRVFRADSGQRCDAIHQRHLDVGQQDVGSMSAIQFYGLMPIARLADDRQSHLALEQPAQPLPHDRVVIRQQDADGGAAVDLISCHSFLLHCAATRR